MIRTISSGVVAKIPIIDLHPYVRGASDTQEISESIRDVCRDVGFFYIKNHGVPIQLQKQIFSNMASFFSQPIEEKNKIHMSLNKKSGTGYFNLGEEVTSGKIDLKEGIYFSHQLEQDHPRVIKNYPIHGNNLFPDSPLNFRSNCLSWIKHMNSIGSILMEGFAQSLKLPRSFLNTGEHKDHIGLMNMIHYPKDELKNPNLWAVGQHTDYGLIVILMTSDKGLQVKTRKGQWLNIDPIEDTFIVNIGDVMQKMTKGLYKSTVHRVRNTEGVSRYSIPFFYDPGWDTQIKQLDFYMSKQEKQIAKQNQLIPRPDKSSLADLKGKYYKYLMKKLSNNSPNIEKLRQYE